MAGQSRWPFTQGTGCGRYYCTCKVGCNVIYLSWKASVAFRILNMSFMNQMAPKLYMRWLLEKKYLGANWLLEFLPNFEPCGSVPKWLCPETALSRCGYVPKRSCPETAMSRNGHVPKWLCPETVMSRSGYVPKRSCPETSGAHLDTCVSYQADTSRIVHQSHTANCLAI